MAAKNRPHIRDYAGALARKEIPAERDGATGTYVFDPVVSVSAARGRARLAWQARVSARGAGGAAVPIDEGWLAPGAKTPPGVVGVVVTTSGQERGKRKESAPTVVASGKNAGKANATNPVTQALRVALSLHNAQEGKAAAAAAPPPEAAPPGACRAPPPGTPYPMLVKKQGAGPGATLTEDDFAAGVTVQRKFNGVRAVAFLGADGGACFYSRTAKPYAVSAALRAQAAALLAAPFPPAGAPAGPYEKAAPYLDGELYRPGWGLRKSSGRARAGGGGGLDFVVYDVFWPAAKAAGHDMPSARRQGYLAALFEKRGACCSGGQSAPRVRRAANFPVASLGEAEELRDAFVREGYEGAIARRDRRGYAYSANGLHSANLLKLKPVHHAEFPVVGYTQGSRGKGVGAVIWVCTVPPALRNLRPRSEQTGEPGEGFYRFTVVPKGMPYANRYHVYRCLGEAVPDDRPGAPAGQTVTRFERDFLGRPLTVEYPELSTKTGKPTQAKSLAFRPAGDGGPAGEGFSPFEEGRAGYARLWRECGFP